MKKMTRVISAIGAMVMSAALLAGCGNSKGAADAGSSAAADSAAVESTYDLTGVTLMSDGVLSVGCEVGYPPFEDFADDGTTPIGYDIDIITEVARRLGLEVNIINTAWDGIFAGIDNNYDVVCSACTITAERQESMAFSTPYISNYQAVILKAGDTKEITSFNDLDGMTVAVQKETTSDELISDYKSTGTIDVEIVANEKILSCFTQLDNGEIDAVCVDSTVADGYLAKNPDKYVYAYKDETEAEQFGVAIGLQNTALKEAIDWALAEMEADGFIQETYDYWFGQAE
ncbi:MAG: transporter substrate-binding domain-containing protein [Lachnospiraceae bacterium]|nr:transporter substrate-binding domain-containing protein [Lachnospiraceae bacterium]